MSLPIFYLNENIAVQVSPLLSAYHITSFHTLNVGNQGVTDEEQLQYASQKGYILATHNRKDFRKIHTSWLGDAKTHSGIVLLTCGTPENISIRIKKFIEDKFPSLQTPFCELLSN